MHNHTLDLLITPSSFKYLSNFQSCDAFSDHLMICADLDISHPPVIKNKIEYRKYHKIDIFLLKEDLLMSDLITSPKHTASELYHQYHYTLCFLLDKYAPKYFKTITARPFATSK